MPPSWTPLTLLMMTIWIWELEPFNCFWYVSHFLSKYQLSPTLIFCCILFFLWHSVLYSWCYQINSSLICITSGLWRIRRSLQYGNSQNIFFCANYARPYNHLTYFQEHANYPHEKLYFEHRNNQFALWFFLHLDIEEE